MRFARRLAGVVLLVALGGGCDTTQPLEVGEQTLSLKFEAINAVTKTFNVWDVFVDNNGDELPDDGIRHPWCETVPPNLNLAPVTVPWTFSVEIKLLRAGETVAETVTSAAALNHTRNVALYDTSTAFTGSTPPKADICTAGGNQTACPLGSSPPSGGNRYRFRNPRRERGANLTLMNATTPSPLFQEIRDDVSPPRGLGQGLCSTGNPGPSNVDGQAQPFTIDIQKGDTLIVKARMANSPPEGGGLVALLADGGIPPTAISATMTLDGRPINLVGQASGRSVSFSYTSR